MGTIGRCHVKEVQVLKIQETKIFFEKFSQFRFIGFLHDVYKHDYTIHTWTQGRSAMFVIFQVTRNKLRVIKQQLYYRVRQKFSYPIS
jgi:hypothetical protein